MYYTNTRREDGFGAQYQSLIFNIVFTEEYRKAVFAYTSPDFVKVYGDEADELEAIMNLKGLFPKKEEVEERGETVIVNNEFKETFPYFEANIDNYIRSASMEKIRRAFNERNGQFAFVKRDENIVNVAVHIRRPSKNPNIDLKEHLEGVDVKTLSIEESARSCPRFSVNDRYLRVMQHLRHKYGGRSRFYIFAEGDMTDFENLKGDDVIFELDKPVDYSFSKLVYADVLVASWSSFSYTAALLSKGEVWYQPFWHRGASHWNRY